MLFWWKLREADSARRWRNKLRSGVNGIEIDGEDYKPFSLFRKCAVAAQHFLLRVRFRDSLRNGRNWAKKVLGKQRNVPWELALLSHSFFLCFMLRSQAVTNEPAIKNRFFACLSFPLCVSWFAIKLLFCSSFDEIFSSSFCFENRLCDSLWGQT